MDPLSWMRLHPGYLCIQVCAWIAVESWPEPASWNPESGSNPTNPNQSQPPLEVDHTLQIRHTFQAFAFRFHFCNFPVSFSDVHSLHEVKEAIFSARQPQHLWDLWICSLIEVGLVGSGWFCSTFPELLSYLGPTYSFTFALVERIHLLNSIFVG